MTQLFCFGHSITHGSKDNEGGWTERLRRHLLKNHDDHSLYNLGISGEDSEQLVRRFEEELERRYWPEEDATILIQVGTNDIQLIHEESNYLEERQGIRVPEENYRENLRKLIEKARDYGKIVIVGEPYTSIEGSIPWVEGVDSSEELLQEYMEIQKRVCEEENVPRIDLRSFDREEWLEKVEDGIHPEDEGHEIIFEEVRQKIQTQGLI